MVLIKVEILIFCLLGGILKGIKAEKDEIKAVELLEIKKPKDPLVFAFENLPKQERNDFLVYFLALGIKNWAESQWGPSKLLFGFRSNMILNNLDIPEKNVEKYKKMYIPKESTKKLLEWTKEEFNLTTADVVELVEKKRLGDSPSLPDVGEFCCPW